MTTLYREKIQCALCGCESEFTGIGSTNAFGSPDLDTRPPEMQRSTIYAWVQRCPECGYCASDISRSNPESAVVVNGAEYQAQLKNHEFLELANSFLCKAIIDRERNDYMSATWALIHAAWARDDAEQPTQARICRTKAATMLIDAEAHNQQVVEQDGASTAILVDLLRRSGQFAEAQKVLATRRNSIKEDIILRILDFQMTLIEKDDDTCHTIDDTLGEDK